MKNEDNARGFRGRGGRGAFRGERGAYRGHYDGERRGGYDADRRGGFDGDRRGGYDGERRGGYQKREGEGEEDDGNFQPRGGYRGGDRGRGSYRARGGDGEEGGRGGRGYFGNNRGGDMDKRNNDTFGAISKDFKLQSEQTPVMGKGGRTKDYPVAVIKDIKIYQPKVEAGEKSATQQKRSNNRFAGMSKPSKEAVQESDSAEEEK